MKTIRVGQSQNNDCILHNPTVSRSHAVITVDDDGQHATIRDLNSTNGTFINNNPNKITTDVRISLYDSLRFGSERTTLAEILCKANKTIIRNTDQQPIADDGRYTIGKNLDNKIVFNHDDVSRKHAVLYKDSIGNVIIEDLSSTNGTYVNGARVTSQVLHPGDKVSITRNYPLAWETIFAQPIPGKTNKSSKKTLLIAIAAIVAVFAIGGIFAYKTTFGTWDKEKIYKEYHTAVCWVYVQYGYQVTVDGEDFTPTLCQVCQIPESSIVHLENDELVGGSIASQGTGFFISNDGKIATNLHISRPWLFSDDSDKLEEASNKILAILASQNPMLVRSKVDVKCLVQNMVVIPDGLPISDENAVACEEIRGYDDIQKDVAVLQTKTRKLPADVHNIIDINNADTSNECLTEGKTVFTIGFPYGAEIAMDSNKDLKNQVHGGSITQNRGDYEFGHDAETANGASGSPIINDKGRLIGVHHAGLTGVTGAQGFNWGIKAKYLVDLLK